MGGSKGAASVGERGDASTGRSPEHSEPQPSSDAGAFRAKISRKSPTPESDAGAFAVWLFPNPATNQPTTTSCLPQGSYPRSDWIEV